MMPRGATLLELLVSLVVLGLLIGGSQLARLPRAAPTSSEQQRQCRATAVRERRVIVDVDSSGLLLCRPDGSVRITRGHKRAGTP